MSKIEEEHDELCSMNEKKRPSKISNPIHISHHTVSGHEAMNLAKRLSEELATRNQTTSSESAVLNLPRALSPDSEPISRSFEGSKKGKLTMNCLSHFGCKCFVLQRDEVINTGNRLSLKTGLD